MSNILAEEAGRWTLSEIAQQAELWPGTVEAAQEFAKGREMLSRTVCFTGAGTSAYAAMAVAASWPDALSKPSTDLLTDDLAVLRRTQALVSLGRSGDSPESAAVIRRLQRELPQVQHFAITCNSEGLLAKSTDVHTLVLDPRTNDKSLAMTSSFSNLVLAGMALRPVPSLTRELPAICERFEKRFAEWRSAAASVAEKGPNRIVFLASAALFGAALEGALKVLEMTAGSVVTHAETFLGLRHGPMSFLRPDSVVVCFFSSDDATRVYEEDLVDELRAKGLGYVVGICGPKWCDGKLDLRIPASAPDLANNLRTPFEIPFAQLLGAELSLRAGLNPDSPSPDGVITRVVRGFRIHESV